MHTKLNLKYGRKDKSNVLQAKRSILNRTEIEIQLAANWSDSKFYLYVDVLLKQEVNLLCQGIPYRSSRSSKLLFDLFFSHFFLLFITSDSDNLSTL